VCYVDRSDVHECGTVTFNCFNCVTRMHGSAMRTNERKHAKIARQVAEWNVDPGKTGIRHRMLSAAALECPQVQFSSLATCTVALWNGGSDIMLSHVFEACTLLYVSVHICLPDCVSGSFTAVHVGVATSPRCMLGVHRLESFHEHHAQSCTHTTIPVTAVLQL
jgi:hypothetical protein